jgi:hypothetical protein
MNKLNLRAFYKPDVKTKDGALKFIPEFLVEGDEEGILWVCCDDDAIKYPFDLPYLDSDWIIQQGTRILDKNQNQIFDGDLIQVRYKSDECGDWDEMTGEIQILSDQYFGLATWIKWLNDDTPDLFSDAKTWYGFSCEIIGNNFDI